MSRLGVFELIVNRGSFKEKLNSFHLKIFNNTFSLFSSKKVCSFLYVFYPYWCDGPLRLW